MSNRPTKCLSASRLLKTFDVTVSFEFFLKWVYRPTPLTASTQPLYSTLLPFPDVRLEMNDSDLESRVQ